MKDLKSEVADYLLFSMGVMGMVVTSILITDIAVFVVNSRLVF